MVAVHDIIMVAVHGVIMVTVHDIIMVAVHGIIMVAVHGIIMVAVHGIIPCTATIEVSSRFLRWKLRSTIHAQFHCRNQLLFSRIHLHGSD